MKIVRNTSNYDTRQLRSLIVLAHRWMRSTQNKPAPNWQHLRVKIGGWSKGHVRGYAFYHGCGDSRGWDMHLRLPQQLTARKMLWLAIHELHHTYGYRHADFTDISDANLARLLPADYSLLPKAQQPARNRAEVTAELVQRRVQRLQQQRARWQSRLKRAQTALRKINKRLARYERKEARQKRNAISTAQMNHEDKAMERE